MLRSFDLFFNAKTNTKPSLTQINENTNDSTNNKTNDTAVPNEENKYEMPNTKNRTKRSTIILVDR